MKDIREINRYSSPLSFLVEFIDEYKRKQDNFDFKDFMKTLYGNEFDIEEFENDFKSICYFLEKLEHLKEIMDKE